MLRYPPVGGNFWLTAAKVRDLGFDVDAPHRPSVPTLAAVQMVWTDGACKGNPGPGGWAWVTPEGRWASGAEAESTNQRMEIKAAYDAVVAHDGPVTIVSDSTYVVNCFRDGWWEGWLERGWKNASKKPVANRDLWEPFIELYRTRDPQPNFEWVKGHSGDEWNEVADRLAVAAAATQAESSGTELPDDLDDLPTDLQPESRSGSTTDSVATEQRETGGRDRRLPAGRLIGVFGVKPPALGGYDANPVADRVGRRVQEVLAAKARMYPDLHVVSGLRLGAEMLGAEAAVAEGIPLVIVLPFPDPDLPWPSASRRRFAELCAAAVAKVTLERKVPDNNKKVGESLRRRDAWLARNLDEAIVVTDGHDAIVGKLVRTLHDKLGDEVWEEFVDRGN